MARKLNERRFQAEAVEINYLEGPPSGPPLVLLHGLAGRWQTFMPLIPALSQAWRVYALDLRGHGKSGRTPGRYHLADYVMDITAFVRDEVGEPVIMVGHSLGGWIATAFTASMPEAVKAVVIGDSAIYPINIVPSASPSPFTNAPIVLRGLAKSASQLDPDVLAMFYDGRLLDGYDPDTLLPAIVCPALLMQADPACGGVMTDRDVARAVQLLARPTAVRFNGIGHGLHVEHAEPVSAMLTGFLKSL